MSDEIKKYPEMGGIYQHYKGGKYEVLTMANHSESGEALVIYKSLLFGSIYARPLSMWFDVVEEARPMKEEVIRFTLIS
jgi:hypothetical protein